MEGDTGIFVPLQLLGSLDSGSQGRFLQNRLLLQGGNRVLQQSGRSVDLFLAGGRVHRVQRSHQGSQHSIHAQRCVQALVDGLGPIDGSLQGRSIELACLLSEGGGLPEVVLGEHAQQLAPGVELVGPRNIKKKIKESARFNVLGVCGSGVMIVRGFEHADADEDVRLVEVRRRGRDGLGAAEQAVVAEALGIGLHDGPGIAAAHGKAREGTVLCVPGDVVILLNERQDRIEQRGIFVVLAADGVIVVRQGDHHGGLGAALGNQIVHNIRRGADAHPVGLVLAPAVDQIDGFVGLVAVRVIPIGQVDAHIKRVAADLVGHVFPAALFCFPGQLNLPGLQKLIVLLLVIGHIDAVVGVLGGGAVGAPDGGVGRVRHHAAA